MSERREAATPEYAYCEFRPGQRVLTKEGPVGVVEDIVEGPGDLTTYYVVLDGGLGGGQYAEAELRAAPGTRSASGVHTADVDYPELGSILHDRPDHRPSIPAEEYFSGRTAARANSGLSALAASLLEGMPARSAAAKVHCAECGQDYFADSEDEFHKHADLYLPPRDPGPAQEVSQGYRDGYEQAQHGAAREPASNEADYRADFDLGWAEGIAMRAPREPEPLTDPDVLSTDGNEARMGSLVFEAGGLWDFVKGKDTPEDVQRREHVYSYDWCRFRKNSRCMYPKELNKAATAEAGYAVWVPEDRGYCTRIAWPDQEKCPVGEPGPHVQGGYLDATVPWEEGGQHGGIPTTPYPHSASLDAVASIDDTAQETSGIVREFALTPTGSDFFAGEADDISRAYRDLPVIDPTVIDLWNDLGALCRMQAEALKARYEIIRLDNVDPYATAAEMYADIDKGVYKVTSLHSNHPVWDVDTNVAFRVVHDLTGHAPSHSDFSLRGEIVAYQNQCAQTPAYLWPALFTEIVAQSAYANVHHLFGEQKVGLIPLTQAQIDAHVGQVMDAPDAAYDAEHRSAALVEEMLTLGQMPVTASAEMGFHLTAAWKDVRAKAKRIRSEGGVKIVSAIPGAVTAQVQGEEHRYQTLLTFVPGKYAVGAWECGCPWAAYSWGRTGPWKKYEGRMCSHALATVYEAQSRGMFGKKVHEDHDIDPAWHKDTKVPGDWNRDLGRYASQVRLASVEDEGVPAHLLVQALAGDGMALEDVCAALAALGVAQPGPVVVQALRAPLRGKVNGRVLNLTFVDGVILLDGNPVQGPVYYPTYDPRAGLDFHATAALTVEADGRDLEAAAKAMLEMARRNEVGTTPVLVTLAEEHGATMAGLEFRFKSLSSLLRKMTAEAHQHGYDAGRTAANMSDSLRYTMLAEPGSYAHTVTSVLAELRSGGYKARVKNYWVEGNNYKGVNCAMMTPTGHPFELQFHTPQSLEVKESEVHPLYEKWRTSSDPAEKADLNKRMKDCFAKVTTPPGAASIAPGIKMGALAYHHAATDDGWQYFAITTHASGHRIGAFRYSPSKGVTEVWKHGEWVEDSSYGSYVFKGTPRAERVTEAEAKEIGQSQHEGALNDMGQVAEVVDENTLHEQGPLAPSGATAAFLFLAEEVDPADPTIDDPGGETIGEDVPAPDDAIIAYGDEDEDVDPLAAHQAVMAGDTTVKDPHAWLKGSGNGDKDVAAAAKEFLAKSALKNFSPAERAQIIDEGVGVRAGNFDGLDLEGTHYLALADQYAREEEGEVWL